MEQSLRSELCNSRSLLVEGTACHVIQEDSFEALLGTQIHYDWRTPELEASSKLRLIDLDLEEALSCDRLRGVSLAIITVGLVVRYYYSIAITIDINMNNITRLYYYYNRLSFHLQNLKLDITMVDLALCLPQVPTESVHTFRTTHRGQYLVILLMLISIATHIIDTLSLRSRMSSSLLRD